jgi:predicted RNase H-like nuclease (RuvC/YqgF family)
MTQAIQSQSDTTSNQGNDSAITLISIESLITRSHAQLNSLKKEMNQFKDMLDSILDSNDEYRQKYEVAKLATKERNTVKTEIMKDPKAQDIIKKLKDYRDQQKELKDALSDYLKQYQQLSGSNQIEGPDGVIREIVYTARLINRFENFKK